jgi:hypothetical protein
MGVPICDAEGSRSQQPQPGLGVSGRERLSQNKRHNLLGRAHGMIAAVQVTTQTQLMVLRATCWSHHCPTRRGRATERVAKSTALSLASANSRRSLAVNPQFSGITPASCWPRPAQYREL